MPKEDIWVQDKDVSGDLSVLANAGSFMDTA